MNIFDEYENFEEYEVGMFIEADEKGPDVSCGLIAQEDFLKEYLIRSIMRMVFEIGKEINHKPQ